MLRFELGDVQDYPFEVGEFDVAISRFGTMFFDDPRVAFRNVARAMRASARLVLMVWQVHDRNEWAVSIDRALGRPPGQSVPGPDPFSLGEPAMVRRVDIGWLHRRHPDRSDRLRPAGQGGQPDRGDRAADPGRWWRGPHHAPGPLPCRRATGS
jgi:SAM-dependent methyltransferase